MSMEPELCDQETQVDALPVPVSVQQIVHSPSQRQVVEEHTFKQTTTKRTFANDFSDKNDDSVGKVSHFAGYFLKLIEVLGVYSSSLIH